MKLNISVKQSIVLISMKNKITFFKDSKKKIKKKRLNYILKNNFENFKPSKDFKNFGYDYFDNKNYLIGYKEYKYDGRYKTIVKKIIKFFKLKKGSSILEIGCAKGFIIKEFKSFGMKVIGIDKSSYVKANTLKSIKKNIKIFKDISKIQSLKNKHFDLLISKESLPHFSLKELKSLVNNLKKFKIDNMLFVIQCIKREKDREYYLKWDKTHKILWKKNQWKKFFRENKLRVKLEFKYLFS